MKGFCTSHESNFHFQNSGCTHEAVLVARHSARWKTVLTILSAFVSKWIRGPLLRNCL